MSKLKPTPEVYVYYRNNGYTNVEIAKIFNTSEASVRRALNKVDYKPSRFNREFMREMSVKLDKPMRLNVEWDGAGAVTADWHHPLTDYGLVNRFLDHAEEIGYTNWLVVAGDWFNMDALSAFDYKQDDASLPRELYGSTEAMTRVLETFKRVYLTWGNHDARIHKTLGYKMRFTTAMRYMFADLDPELLARIQFSGLDHLWIDTPRGPYYVAHPKAYNSNPLTSARKIAGIKQAHVLLGHSHHTAIGHDPSGKFVVGELGGFHDKNKTEYLQRTTTYPEWQQGYGFIDTRGFLSIEGEGWSARVSKEGNGV